ncbi:MAG: pyridoxamine 5'-phosphate oxidase [Jatrophihabitantaceae bacterium]
MSDPAGMRRGYLRGWLDEGAAPRDWLKLFGHWFDEAAAELSGLEVNAMQLATVDAAGRPAVRTVLAKGFDERGVVFYTNYDSAKARDLAVHPYAATIFAWVRQERQVRFTGPVVRVSRAETESYFATRPRGSQLGAWASPQSSVVASRSVLDEAEAAVAARFAGQDIPAPPHWGGFRLEPDAVEFWQGRPDRLHDRLRYRLDAGSWTIERLAP